jgi:hypothetical protein
MIRRTVKQLADIFFSVLVLSTGREKEGEKSPFYSPSLSVSVGDPKSLFSDPAPSLLSLRPWPGLFFKRTFLKSNLIFVSRSSVANRKTCLEQK